MAEVETIENQMRKAINRPLAPTRVGGPELAPSVPPSLRTAAAVEVSDTIDAALGNLSWRTVRAAKKAATVMNDLDAWMEVERAYDEKVNQRS